MATDEMTDGRRHETTSVCAADTGNALRIALLEDDALLRERILVPGLRAYGFSVITAGRVGELDAQLARAPVDIVVLDVGLPDGDGYSVARRLRDGDAALGIVMLTGRRETPDRVRGLGEGADAYLVKPVELELLAATLYSLARRMGVGAPVSPAATPVWRMDANGWCLLSPGGNSVALTRGERRIMARLAASPAALVTRAELIAALTNDVYDFDPHRLDSMIHRLRRKVESGCEAPLPLSAVHGEGYVFAG